MNLLKKANQKVEDIYRFYNVAETGKQNGIMRSLFNHRFLLCSKLMNLAWQPVYYGAAVLSFFDQGKYNHEKVVAMAATSPALIAGFIFFGAFWAKLGSAERLRESWQESKSGTMLQIAKGNFVGNFLWDYYKIRTAYSHMRNATEKVVQGYDNACIKTLEIIADRSPELAQGITDLGNRGSVFYCMHIMPRI